MTSKTTRKTTTRKTTTGKTTAAKRTTAARSATARAAAAAADVEELEGLEDGGAVEGRVIADMPATSSGHDHDDYDADGGYERPDRGPVEVDPELSFTSTEKDRDAEGVGVEVPFSVDGETYIARKPSDDEFILMTVAAAQSTPMADRVAAIVEFLAAAVDEQDFLRLRARLKDPKDNFSFPDLLTVMQKVVKNFPKSGPKQARALARPPRR